MAKNGLNVKKRNWAFVCYPESLPENWLQKLQQTGLPCVVSPLHDKDNNADETEKKPHYHIILCYSGPTAYNVVKRITDSLNATIPQPLESIKGYYRYLTHKDNPEKYQYDDKDIKALNGFNIGDFVELTKSELLAMKEEIFTLIQSNDITEYNDLLLYLQAIERKDLFDVAISNTMAFNSIVKSRRHKKELH